MSRNRAFRLLKDARARASATSVGGASSRVGGHAAVNATNLTRYVPLRALLSKERRICFFCAHFSKNASKTGDPEFVGTVLGGKRARKAFARANNGSANEDKSDGGTFERDFRAMFRSRTFSVFFLSPVGGGLPKFSIEKVFFFFPRCRSVSTSKCSSSDRNLSFLLFLPCEQCTSGRRPSRFLASRATAHEICVEHSENHEGDEDGRCVAFKTSSR